MIPLSPTLVSILRSKFQAGADGFRSLVEISLDGGATWTTIPGAKSISIDKSASSVADDCEVVFDNADGTKSPYGPGVNLFDLGNQIRVSQWYGDSADAVVTFWGLIDKVHDHRELKTMTVTARDFSELLIEQTIILTAPQDASDPTSVRDTSNYVYLNYEVSSIVSDLLDKADYPADLREIQGTNLVLAEFDGSDGESYADAIGRLADASGYDLWTTEDKVVHFRPLMQQDQDTGTADVPVWTFDGAHDVHVIDPDIDDYDLKTRVVVSGTYNSTSEAYQEEWHTGVVGNPFGVAEDPSDTGYIRILDGIGRKVYKVSQADQSIVASTSTLGRSGVICTGFSFDPSDSTIFWILDEPKQNGGSADPVLYKYRRSDDALLASYTITRDGSAQYTGLRVTASYVWITTPNVSSPKLRRFSKSTGAAGPTYTPGGGLFSVGHDGSTLYYSTTTGRIYTASESTPATTTLLAAISGFYFSIEVDTSDPTYLYAADPDSNLTYKYHLVSTSTTEKVSATAINDALELALGVKAGITRVIRPLLIRDQIFDNLSQAQEAANRWLAKIGIYRRVTDIGIIGNPGIQKGDMVHVNDPPLGVDIDTMVDTYRAEMSADGTYLGMLSLVPWNPYGGSPTVLPPPPPSVFDVTTPSAGGWSWFGDPRAVYYGGYTYIGYVRGDNGDVVVRAWSHASQSTAAEVTLHAGFEVDDHAAPSLYVSPTTHKLVCYYSKHNDTVSMKQRTSTNSLDTDPTLSGGFAAEQTHVFSGDPSYPKFFTYPNPMYLSNQDGGGPLEVLFYRNHSYSAILGPHYTNGGVDGDSWSGGVAILSQVPYFKVATDGVGRIDVAQTYAPNGTLGGDLSKVWHLYRESAAWHTSDGTSITGTVPYSESKMTVVFDGSGASDKVWVWDIAYEDATHPIIVFARFPGGDSTDERYMYARWNGASWDVNEIATGGDSLTALEDYYSGGVILDHSDTSVVYYAKQSGTGSWDIYKASTGDSGATWSSTKITATGKNFRPMVPRDHAAGLNVVWLLGTYNDYTDYSLGVSGSDI